MDNTIVVVFSDHGTEFYEHEKFDHGHTLYGELVDILFSIRLPGQEQGKRVDSLVSTLDIMPTVLKLIGVENPVPKQTKGIDLTPSFTGTDVSRSVFSETDYRLYTHKRSIQMPEGWKLIVTYPGKEKELYNLRSDPAEKANLADIETAKADELGKLIDEHLNRMNATGPWTLGCVPVYNDQCKDPASSPASQQTLAGKKNLNSNKPNILLINIDSFRADHMGIYGYQRNITPFMDSFFRKGVIFDTAIATGPYTFHTDASIFTSLYPSQNGVYTWRTPQRKDAISLTKILKDKGYRTGAFVSQGLFMESFTLAYFDIYSKNNDVKNLNASSQKARDWIALNDTPYFAFWHLYDVHLPYMPPTKDFYARPYNGFFSNKSIYISWPRQTSKTIEHTNENGTNSSQYVITPADIEYLRESYDYGILATDKGLESFFQSLKKSGYLNNTIVIISSEHGEDLKEHGYFFHSDVYENNMHVPLVIYYPGITPRRITEPVSSLDIMPTVLGLINETIPPGLEGVDLFAPGALNMSRAVYSERPPNGEFAVRTDRWKYILRNPDLKSKESLNFIKKIDKENKFFYLIALNDENTGDELYDLSADPNEQNNLIGKGFPAEEELKAKVTEFRDRMNAAKEKNQIGEHLNEVPIFSYP